MKYVVVDDRKQGKLLHLDEFIKEYNITPKCRGDHFYVIAGDDLDIIELPNNAALFQDGRIKYVIMKGGVTIINGVRQPSADVLEESQVFATYEDAQHAIDEVYKEHEGERTLTLRTGQQIFLGK